MNDEIKSIMNELKIIYDFYQDKFSLKIIKGSILSMPEGSHIIKVQSGDVSLYDQDVSLPIGYFNDASDSVGLLQISHTMVTKRDSEAITNDSQRISILINRLISLIAPQK